MAMFLQALGSTGFGKILTRENQRNIPVLVVKRHRIAERISAQRPADIYTCRLVDPRSCAVEGLMTDRFDHPLELRLSLLARSLRDYTYNSWHAGGRKTLELRRTTN